MRRNPSRLREMGLHRRPDAPRASSASARRPRDPKYSAYIKRSIDSLVRPDGRIATYSAQEYNLDQINEGRALFALADRTHDSRYTRKPPTRCANSCAHIRARPKADSGTRRSIRSRCGSTASTWPSRSTPSTPMRHGDTAAMNDVARQFLLVARHLRDPKTGLYYHAWDSVRQQPWADTATGLSQEFLGSRRGLVSHGRTRRARLPAEDASRSRRDHSRRAATVRRRRARAGPGERRLVAGARPAESRQELSRGVGLVDVHVRVRQGRAARHPCAELSRRAPSARLME